MPQSPPTPSPTVLQGDLNEEQLERYASQGEIAVDTETMGLNLLRDRLCLVQVCDREGRVTLVQIPREGADLDRAQRAPRLKRLLEAPSVLKVFHFARFDVAALRHHLGIHVDPVYCTRTASRIVRTYSERHSLKDIALELLNVEMDKAACHTDWSRASLTTEQIRYATSDVVLLLPLRDQLEAMLVREQRSQLAQSCFRAIPVLAELDLMGYGDILAFGVR